MSKFKNTFKGVVRRRAANALLNIILRVVVAILSFLLLAYVVIFM